MPETLTAPAGTVIRRLVIKRFRGIDTLDWNPDSGLNFILGGGDSGKSTILDAISLLLSPTNSITLSEWDYWQRKVTDEFLIEAAIEVPASVGINQQSAMNLPWAWDGAKQCLPEPDENTLFDQGDSRPAVYVIRARGTDQLDLVHELVRPDDSTIPFSQALRRAIGMVRLSSDDRHERDLRLVQGSALDRLLKDKRLKARVASKLGESEFGSHLEDDAKERLSELGKSFAKRQLPSLLDLGLTGGPGLSLNALIGLTAKQGGADTVALPMSTWGAGTRRLAALTIALALRDQLPIAVVDEIERGLEPYRQRSLINSLASSRAQIFVTTHSAVAIAAASGASLWHKSTNAIGRLQGDGVLQHQIREPEAFLSRLTVFAEGATEVGFIEYLLQRALKSSLLDHGIWLADGQGSYTTLDLLESLSRSGLRFSAFVDNEDESPTRWAALKTLLGSLLFQWQTGCLEENAISLVPRESIEALITDPAGELTGYRLRTLAERLGMTGDVSYATIAERAGDGLTQLIIDAAMGKVPVKDPPLNASESKAMKKHAQSWFKSRAGGKELAQKLFDLGLWAQLEATLLPFINAVEAEVGVPKTRTMLS